MINVVAGQLLLPPLSAGQLGSLQLPGQQTPEPVLLVPQQLRGLQQTPGSPGGHSQGGGSLVQQLLGPL